MICFYLIKEKVVLVHQIMNFKNWCTEEIVCWLWDYETIPSLQTVNNYKTYISAIDELKIRKLNQNDIAKLFKKEELL